MIGEAAGREDAGERAAERWRSCEEINVRLGASPGATSRTGVLVMDDVDALGYKP